MQLSNEPEGKHSQSQERSSKSQRPYNKTRYNSKSTRNILVTGGCGFVGRHLVNRLFEDPNATVHIVDNLVSEGDRSHPNNWITQGVGNRVWFWRMSLEDWLRRVDSVDPQYYDEVYHLAAIIGGRIKIDHDPLLVANDLAIDAQFFDWLRLNKDRIGRVLYASSSAVYPTWKQAQPYSNDPLHERDVEFHKDEIGIPDMTYGWAKMTGEYLARLAYSQYGINIAIIRPFSGYGEDQDLAYPVPAIADRVARGDDPIKVWGTGEQVRDFVYIEDCIDCMLLAIQKISNANAVNISSGRGTNFLGIISLLVDIRDNTIDSTPKIDCDETKPMGVSIRVGHNYMAKQLLGWEPKTSLKEGLTKVLVHAQKRYATRSVEG